MSFQTHYYPRAGVGLHSSWGGWDGGNLGYMGTVVVWDPPRERGKGEVSSCWSFLQNSCV